MPPSVQTTPNSPAHQSAPSEWIPEPLSAYDLIERAQTRGTIPKSLREYLAVEMMAVYLAIAADPHHCGVKCLRFADDLISRPKPGRAS